MPKTPIYLHNDCLGARLSKIKGVEWCPNFPPNLPIDHSINNRGIPINKKQTR